MKHDTMAAFLFLLAITYFTAGFTDPRFFPLGWLIIIAQLLHRKN